MGRKAEGGGEGSMEREVNTNECVCVGKYMNS